jgi:hypothetical protein
MDPAQPGAPDQDEGACRREAAMSSLHHDRIAHGTPDALRDFIGEHLALAALQAELGATYAAIADDAGLEYAVRRLVAYTRAAIGTLADLKGHKEDGGRL